MFDRRVLKLTSFKAIPYLSNNKPLAEGNGRGYNRSNETQHRTAPNNCRSKLILVDNQAIPSEI